MVSDAQNFIRQFLALQEQRIRAYKRLDQAHAVYLSSSPNYEFLTYRQVVHEVTEEFTAISAAIIAIIESLSEEESQQQPCVNFMSSVQNEEKEKLELVVRLQLLKQCVLDNEGSLKMQYEDEERQLKLRVSALEERIAEHIEELRYEIANE